MGSAGAEVVDLAASAGLVLDPWQVDVLELGLAEGSDGLWASMEVGLVVPRQNGKSAIFEALILAGLFLFGEETIVYTAHEFKTAGEVFRRLTAMVKDTPHLNRQVKQIHLSKGAEGIELHSGQRLKVVARSKGSGRGFSGDRVLFDEAYDLDSGTISALIPTLSAMPNPQVWYASSAPLDEARSDDLRDIIKQGRAGEIAYMEWSTEAPKDATPEQLAELAQDYEAIAAANPGWGVRLNKRFIENVERKRLTLEAFLRERLGIFPDPEDEADRVIPAGEWNATANPSSQITGRVVPAFDLSPDRRSVTFAVAGEAGDLVHLELTDAAHAKTKPTTAAIVARAKALADKLGSPIAIAKGSPAWSLEPDLIEADVPLRVVDTAEHAQACGSFVSAVTDRTVCHLNDDDLNRAVDGAASRDYGDGAWLWSRRKASVDITPLVAVTLARWVLISDAPETEPALAAY